MQWSALDIRARTKIEDDDGRIIGQVVQIKANKNQASRPFLKTEIDMIFGIGYDNTKWCIEKALELGVIVKQKKKTFVYNYNFDYLTSEEERDMTLIQLTEIFSNSKRLEKLYATCVEYNNREITILCEERKSKKGKGNTLAADKELNEPDL